MSKANVDKKPTKEVASSGVTAKDIAVGRTDVHKFKPSDLHVEEGWNVRDNNTEYKEYISQLALSIAKVGVREPLKGYMRDGRLIITNGHSRRLAVLEAIKEHGADIRSVPVMLEDRYASEADRTLTILVSNSGRPLSVLEQGKVFKRLAAYGWEPSEIAAKAGVSMTTVTRALDLQAAPEAIKEMVSEGTVSASLAIETIKLKGTKAAETLIDAQQEAKKQGKTKVTQKTVQKSEQIKDKEKAKANPQPAKPKKLSLQERLETLCKEWDTADIQKDGEQVTMVFNRESYVMIDRLINGMEPVEAYDDKD